MMEEQVARFPEEFSYEPELVGSLPQGLPIVLCGMGGSHLGARLLMRDDACPPLYIHSDYGLPSLPDAWKSGALYVASSYSGETEETIDAARAAKASGYPLAIIASGGTLLAYAKENNIPYVAVPQEDIEPRMTMGYQMLALAKIIGSDALIKNVRDAGSALDLEEARTAGASLAETIGTRVPVFYASSRNSGLAYHLKADMNETGKVPAAYNIVPELCHNELSGYETRNDALLPVFLNDDEDDARIKDRMRLMETMLGEHKVATASLAVSGNSALHKGLRIVLIGAFSGALIAKRLHVEDAKTPLIAEFKRRLHE